MKKLLISTMLIIGSFNAYALANDTIHVVGASMTPGTNMQAKSNDGGILEFVLQDRDMQPFCQAAVIQSTAQAKQGPSLKKPYFHVRCALPIPPVYTKNDVAALTGIDFGVYRHNHSPGFEVADNGDALAVYFSTPAGKQRKIPQRHSCRLVCAMDVKTGICPSCSLLLKGRTTSQDFSGMTRVHYGSSAVAGISPTMFLSVLRNQPTTEQHGHTPFLSLTVLQKTIPHNLSVMPSVETTGLSIWPWMPAEA